MSTSIEVKPVGLSLETAHSRTFDGLRNKVYLSTVMPLNTTLSNTGA